MTDVDELDNRSKNLKSLTDKLDEPLVGIRLDILRKIMDDLDENPKLVKLFGSPVCSKLAVVPDVNDIWVTELNLVKLSGEQKKEFQGELSAIMQKRIKEAEAAEAPPSK